MIVSHEPRTSSEPTASRFFLILWNRKLIVFSCLVAGLGLAAIKYVTTPPRYTAEAIIALDLRKLQALPTESVVAPLPQESPALRTELDIISSQTMAQRVLDRMRKHATDADGSATVSSEEGLAFFASGQATGAPVSEATQATERDLIKMLMKNVRVMNDGRSYTIYIDFTADDPTLAAMVANAYGESYIDYQIDLQTSATRRVSDWLGERLVTLRSKLEESENLATTFRQSQGIVKTDGTTLQSQQITGLNGELTQVQAKVAASKARLETALEAESAGGDLDLVEVLGSQSIQQLRSEQARINRSIAEIDDSGAAKNVQLPQLKSQLETIKGQVATEVSRIIDSLRTEIAIDQKQQASLEASLAELRNELAKSSDLVVHADQLDREAAANRTIYESYLARYKQTIEQDGIASAEARIISQAMTSKRPTSPNAILFGIAGFLLGAFAGVVAAFARHLMAERSVRSADLLEAKTGLAVIGKVPAVSFNQKTDGVRLLHDPKSPLGAAMAEIQSRLAPFADAAPPWVIAITSVADGDGKTFVTANLARSLAATGIRTLVIEANLRGPTLAGQFEVRAPSYLDQAVMQEMPFAGVVQHDTNSLVDFIPAKMNNAPEALLANRRFPLLIQDMKKLYDLVLIDTPSASYGFDLMRIVSLSDLVLCVVRPGETTISDLHSFMNKLQAANRTIGGLIYNLNTRVNKGAGKPPKAGIPGRLFSMPGRKKQDNQVPPLAARV